jgi:alpha-tubulin suppressor-like RCC1 family protein
MNSITFNTNFTRILLLKIAVLAVLINTAIAGEGSIELNRFTEVDVSSANNDSGGYYNASNHPNHNAFATLQADGSITAWGDSRYGGTAPSGSGYTKIYSSRYAFAALKADGSITAWGDSGAGGTRAPSGKGYTKIYSTRLAFAAIKADGSITAWGDSRYGGKDAPSDKGYTKIYSTGYAFAALKTDGSIVAWGDSNSGGTAPSGSGYTKIYSTGYAFAALKTDGSIVAWGESNRGGTSPSGNGYTKIYSTDFAFAAIKTDGSIVAWGTPGKGSTAPSGSSYTKIYSTSGAFAALKTNGSIVAWGDSSFGGTGAPSGSYTKIYSTGRAFAVIKTDGSIAAWGGSVYGGTAPSGSSYTKIYSTGYAFAALKTNGSIVAWGDSSAGGASAPSGSGYTKIYSTQLAFVAIKADGSIVAWGRATAGGTTPAPNLANATGADQIVIIDSVITDITFSNSGGAIASCTVTPALPAGLSIDSATCTISGTPTEVRALSVYTVTAKDATDNTGSAIVSLTVNTQDSTNKLNRFPEVDFSSAYNNNGGYYNASNHPNSYAFATLQADGSITAWGDSRYGGTAPSGSGHTKIYSNMFAFAALKADGSIVAWGDSNRGGTGAPPGKGYTKIYSTESAFAALKTDGSIVAWGNSRSGGTAPSGSDYTKIYSSGYAFAALKADGSITAWGNTNSGGTSPSGNATIDKPASGYTKIYSTRDAFAALKADGSITTWGNTNSGGTDAPSGSGYTKIYSNWKAFAVIKADGSIVAWGDPDAGGTSPSGSGYTKIYSTGSAFAALKTDGSITAWGDSGFGGTSPSGSNYTKIYSNWRAFAALKTDGSITAWGGSNVGGTAPSGSGYTKIYSAGYAFAALKTDGSITTWGDLRYGGTSPSGSGYTKIYSNLQAFVALKADESITAWGGSNVGGTTPAPNLANATGADQIVIIDSVITDITFSNSGGAIASCTVTPALPAGLSIDSATCTISGTPTEVRALSVYTVTAKDAKGNTGSASLSLTVNTPAPNIANVADQVAIIGSAITDITFSNSGGAIASCTVAPTLPAGLSIDSTTCTISGTPTEVRVLTLYTVTAKNAADDTDSTTFSLTVNAPAPNLANAVATNQIAFIDFTITDITFNNSGGAIASCTVAPTLPAGLSIDSTTCTISGTPTEVRTLSVYTVTAKNATDDDSASFSLTVNAAAATPNIANAVDQIAITGSVITDITFNNSGGAIASCTVAPTLPAGLSIDSTTCTISGTPTEVRTLSVYTVTAKNATYDKEDSASFSLTVNAPTSKLNRFTEVDVSSANNDSGGYYNASNVPNHNAFATLQADGSIKAWGSPGYGGTAPSGSGYTKIYSTAFAFAALKTDGSIVAWGDSSFGGTGAPSGSGYTKIYSTMTAFAAIKTDGSIKAWGELNYGGSGAPSTGGYTKIYSNSSAFAALKADGTITAWGNPSYGGTGVPSGSGYTKIYSTAFAFAALKADGSIKAWGDSNSGGINAPSTGVYTKIYSTAFAFAALKADGTITAWGDSRYGGTAPSGSDYTKIYSTKYAFAALKADGSITVWGDSRYGGTGAPAGSGYTKIYSTRTAFAVIKTDGTIAVWGDSRYGGSNAPSDSGYTKIYSTSNAFAAIKADGTITAWGASYSGGVGAPVDNGYIKIYSTGRAFVAIKADGTITRWGPSYAGGITLAPKLTTAVNTNQMAIIGSAITNITFSNSGGAITSCTVAPTLPAGLSTNSATCTISGTPTEVKAVTLYTVTATNTIGQTATAGVYLTILLADPAPTTLTAVATGVPNEVTLSWAGVTGATAYRLYQTTDAAFATAGNSDPSQFSAYSPAATSTDTTATSITMTLSGTATVYYVVTAINGTVESFSNTTPVAATAHAFEFGKVTSSTGQIWMDRNLGASRVATSSTDPASYGDLYQWGRPADGHQIRTSAITATLAANTTPGHANFITITGPRGPYDWTIPHTGDVDGALRSAFFAKTDGSGICPTGFNVPTEAQLKAEVDIWDTTNNAAVGAFNSVLKLPVAGSRLRWTGGLGNVGDVAYYWTRSVMPDSPWHQYARYLYFGKGQNTHPAFYNIERSDGNSIRCIKN